MPLGDIGGVVAAIHQQVVPGGVLGRAAAGHRLIPLVAQLELVVGLEDGAAIAELQVLDDLAGVESSHSVVLLGGARPLMGDLLAFGDGAAKGKSPEKNCCTRPKLR